MQYEIETAVRTNDLQRLVEVLNSGFDVNSQDEYGWTNLHYAAAKGHLEMVELLIMRGSHVNISPSSRTTTTPLMRAAVAVEPKVAELLLKHNAEINFQDDLNRTALHMAALYNRRDTTRLLLSYGADYNIKDHRNETPEQLTSDAEVLTLFRKKRELDADKDGTSAEKSKP